MHRPRCSCQNMVVELVTVTVKRVEQPIETVMLMQDRIEEPNLLLASSALQANKY